jgi:hypothetical protein
MKAIVNVQFECETISDIDRVAALIKEALDPRQPGEDVPKVKKTDTSKLPTLPKKTVEEIEKITKPAKSKAPPPPADDDEEDEDLEEEDDEDEEEDDADEEEEAAPAGKSKIKVTDELREATKLREVLSILIEKHDINSKKQLLRECNALKKDVPVLQRIQDLEQRVGKAAELLKPDIRE